MDDEDCNLKNCFSCAFEKEVFFKLRGICSGSSKIDSDYLLKFDSPKQGNFYFRGFSGLTSISYYEGQKGWLLLSYRLNGSDAILGIFNDTSTTFPIGLQNWYLRGSCDIINQELIIEKLKLTKVIVL